MFATANPSRGGSSKAETSLSIQYSNFFALGSYFLSPIEDI